jgi:hypothetical protein
LGFEVFLVLTPMANKVYAPVMGNPEPSTREMEYEPIGYHDDPSCGGEVRKYVVAATPTRTVLTSRLCIDCGGEGPQLKVTEALPRGVFDDLVIDEEA